MKRLIISSVILVFIFVAYAILPPERTGNFLVTSFGNDSIAVYDSLGNYLRTFTAPGVSGPRGIVFAPDNKIYIASQFTGEIFVFNSAEQFITKFTSA
ncbi:MAG: hypothetical protein IIB08_00785 [Bacteroidetes bacterium]|nr:hypothetical protein [Bacteroidota bacterium]